MKKLKEQDLRFLEYFEPSWVKAVPIVIFILTAGMGFFIFFTLGGAAAPGMWFSQFQIDPEETYSGRTYYILFFLNISMFLMIFGIVHLIMGLYLTRVKHREKETRRRVLLHIRELEARMGPGS